MKALLASLLAATVSSATLATTISFPNNPVIPPQQDSRIATNFVDTGFRFSPEGHLDGLYLIDHHGSVNNDNYLGTIGGGEGGAFYVDFFGKPFSLISLTPLESIDVGGGEIYRRWEIDVTSSKGGYFSFLDETEMFFTGDEWSNITWFVVGSHYGDPSQGAANFVVSIPEPAPLTLIGIALVGLAFNRRRAMSIK